MTAIEDARAALAEWGEHLTDAPSQSRSDRMAAALRALIAERTALWDSPRACFGHCDKEGWYSECVSKLAEERLTAPPTDDEREALHKVLWDNVYDGGGGMIDGPQFDALVNDIATNVFAAGFRRQGSPADEWEYATAIRDRVDGGLYDIWPTEQPMSAEQIAEWVAQDREGWVNYPPERTVVNVRRRKAVEAGPWEPVEAARGVPC